MLAFIIIWNLRITTEDKYGSTPINSTHCATDEDEEFLKSNETMKDITPPKLVPAVTAPPSTLTNSAAKQLYPLSPLMTKSEVKTEPVKADISDVLLINGLIPTSTELKTSM